LRHILQRGLTHTQAMWPDIEQGFAWVHQAAHILANHNHLSGDQVRQIYTDLLDTMSSSLVPTPASAPTPAHEQAGMLAPAINHFLKVTRSYEPGLFHCYDVPELPRTNNDLEQLFGSFRYHERRASGRKVAAPSIVVRGATCRRDGNPSTNVLCRRSRAMR
jgi:hypothetical protein